MMLCREGKNEKNRDKQKSKLSKQDYFKKAKKN
jgi:hypothetical protein